MATLVLGVGGSLVPGAGIVLGAIGAAVGSYIDNAFVFPALFKDEGREAPNTGGIEITLANEGEPATYCLGDWNRIAGNIVWKSDLYAVSRSGNSKRGTPPSISWYADVAIGITHNEFPNLYQVWIDGDSAFVSSGQIVGSQVSLTGPTVDGDVILDQQKFYGAFIDGSGLVSLSRWAIEIRSQQDGSGRPTAGALGYVDGWYEGAFASVRVDYAGGSFQVSRDSTGAADDWLIERVGVDDSRGNWSVVLDILPSFVPAFYSFAGAPSTFPPPIGAPFAFPVPDGASIQLTFKGTNFNPKVFTEGAPDVAFYNGLQNSTVRDDAIVAREGDNAPTFPSMAYWRIRALNLSGFGNRLPTFSFRGKGYSGPGLILTQRNLVVALGTYFGGLEAFRLRVNRISDSVADADIIPGLQFRSPYQSDELLREFLLMFGFVAREWGGLVEVFPIEDRDVWPEVDAQRVLGRPEGSSAAVPMQFRNIDDADRPARVYVKFRDIGKSLQDSTEHDQRTAIEYRGGIGGKYSERKVTTRYAMDRTRAKAAARRILRDSHERVREVSGMRAMVSMLGMQEEDIVPFRVDLSGETTHVEQTLRVLISQVEIGADFTIQAQGFLIHADEEGQPFLAESGLNSGDTLDVPPVPLVSEQATLLYFSILDIPPVHDDHAVKPGFYVVSSPFSRNLAPSAGALFESSPGGEDWKSVATFLGACVHGSISDGYDSDATGLSKTASPTVWDRTSVIYVEMIFGELESAPSEEDVANGDNWIALASGEVVGFLNATLVADGIYRLDTFLRGRLGTEEFIADHADYVREAFALTSSLEFVRMQAGEMGLTRSYKATSPSVDIDSATEFPKTIEGNTARPLPPAYVETSESGNDRVISWTHRTALRWRAFSTNPPPVLDGETNGAVEILDGGSVVRTIDSTDGSLSATYTSAMQDADGLDGETGIVVRVYQVGDIGGRSRYVETTVDGYNS